MAMSTANISLTSLLPSPYVLIYSVPLLISTLTITIAGAFLTLDRTCTFAPLAPDTSLPGHYDLQDEKSKSKAWWGLEGGVGGLAGGWTFGVYLATFLSLLIMNNTTDAPLTQVQFLLINLASSLIFMFLGGRFKLVALTCIGIAGGVSLALILAVILHPTLLTRHIFVAILAPLCAIAALLPVPQTQHSAVRLAAASAGSFGTVVVIALLAKVPPWSNVWERLWMQISPSNEWGTTAERALSAAACIMLVAGIASDWFLRRTFGENPDQKWDSYLAQYATTLPHLGDRAGSFQPVLPFWQRLFRSTPANPVIFPSDAELKPTRWTGLPESYDDIRVYSNPAKSPHKRSEVKFQPLGGYSDSDSDSEPEWEHKAPPHSYSPPQRPWLPKQVVSSTALSDTTLYGSNDVTENAKTGISPVNLPKTINLENYSDSEGEDITTPNSTPLKRSKSHRDEPGWKPEFLSRHGQTSASQTSTPSVTAVSHNPPGAVPMTPSLIRAIDRIAIAQDEAYGHTSPPPLSPPALPRTESREKWKRFWDQVQQKANT